ncbi:hypothetical protein ACIPRL_35540 [Streptomyces sp. NPDC090085]|uniref:hypothetical protein n=1 Tax=Streptomyces sp. NPDC090085 TaxID=3365943 RepID=UPI00382139C0
MNAPSLIDQIRALPTEVLTRLQYLAPATGCFNRCSLCSQAAGREVWQLTRPGLYALMTALATVANERGVRIARGRDAHRPGTIFPYLDNDIMSYPYLDDYMSLADRELGAKVRVSTVGYSAAAPDLCAMHRRIAAEFVHVLDGVRLSLTPYTLGWTDRAAESTTRQQFTKDLTNLLATYRPAFDQLGHGAATAAVELRFAPLLGIVEVTETSIDGHHVVTAGPHTLISTQPITDPVPHARVSALTENNQPVFSVPPRRYIHITAPELDSTAVRAAITGTLNRPHERREVDLYRFSNADGPYYAANPTFAEDGRFTALHIYLATERRKVSGYTDATRTFLNTLLGIKAGKGIARREPFPAATWHDVQEIVQKMTDRAIALDAIDPTAAEHIRTEVLPIVETYTSAMRAAGYPAAAVFSREFTIDTGQIVNQGRGMGLFRGLAATTDEPMTPREERGYGEVSVSSARGTVWRIAPIPFTPAGRLTVAVKGGKNLTADTPSLVIEELDPRHLRNTDRATGEPLRRFVLTGVEMEHITLDQGRNRRAFPGLAH